MIVCDSGTFRFKCDDPSPNLMSSQDLEELNLKAGLNEARYVCPELGEIIEFHIFLYSEADKLVLTDIDGTITESDIKGHLAPWLGLSCHHLGVVSLLDGLASRGYRVVYLTARSMAQEEDTKAYLFSTVKNQEGKSLPAGPIIFSPTNFISGLIAEVVTGSPHIQKTKMILELWATFKSENRTDINQVVVAGYGNKDTDTKAYLEAGLLPHKLFIVNPQGRKYSIHFT